jgi:hypothetical protein
MFRNCLRLAAAVVLTMVLGAVATAGTTSHQPWLVGADGYYSPAGNNVTWPVGPSTF